MKNLRRTLKSNGNGITLIALVITIVVLIILSAVTIGSLTGKKGIVTQANLAKKEYEIEDAKERAKIDISDWIMSQVVSGKDSTLSNSTIKSILDGKDYVKQANATSFITKNGEHETLYSDLTTENVKDEDPGNKPANGINIAEIVAGTAPNNCTDKIEELGIPLINKYPGTSQNNVISRKVWDMQLYNNRIYIGSGDYDKNTGPVDVYYYDIASAKFVNEGTLQDEQINRFVIVNDKLMIPGTDPKESWEWGNYFVWENNAWTKKRNLPGGVHNFDLIEFKGNIFAGIDSENDSTIVKSIDGGETFSHVFLYDESGNKIEITPETTNNSYRVYDLFELQNTLYAFCGWRIFKYDETKNIFQRLPGNTVSYGYMPAVCYVPLKTKTVFNDKLIMVHGSIKYTDDLQTYKTVPFDKTTYVYDVLERNGELYFLCNTPVSNGFMTSVYKTSDCENFELVLYYNYADYAFSFEYDNNCFYFGIGTTAISGDKAANSGQILKIELE